MAAVHGLESAAYKVYGSRSMGHFHFGGKEFYGGPPYTRP